MTCTWNGIIHAYIHKYMDGWMDGHASMHTQWVLDTIYHLVSRVLESKSTLVSTAPLVWRSSTHPLACDHISPLSCLPASSLLLSPLRTL